MGFDLSKSSLKPTLPGSFRDQDSGRPHQRIDDVTDTEQELFYTPGNSGADESFIIIDLRLLQRGLGTCFLGRQKC